MHFRACDVAARGHRISLEVDGEEVGHAYLYLMTNDIHGDEPFGLLEDVAVKKEHQRKGYSKDLVREVIETAKRAGCYKLIATSRHHAEAHVQPIYLDLGFRNWGLEFRLNFRESGTS